MDRRLTVPSVSGCVPATEMGAATPPAALAAVGTQPDTDGVKRGRRGAEECAPTVVRQVCDVRHGALVDLRVGAIRYERCAVHGSGGVVGDGDAVGATHIERLIRRRARRGETLRIYVVLDGDRDADCRRTGRRRGAARVPRGGRVIDRDELRLDRHYRFAERMAAGATTHWEWVHWASERDAREQELRAFGGARQELADGTTAG